MCDITHKGTRSRFSTGIKVDTKAWDKKRGEVRQGAANAAVINQRLSKIRKDIGAAFVLIQLDDIAPTAPLIKARFKKESEERQKGFWDRWQEFEQSSVSTKKESTQKRWRNIKNKLLEYEAETGPLLFSQFDFQFAEDFRKWLYSKGNNKNTASRKIKEVITFLRYVEKKQWYIFGQKIKDWNVKVDPPGDDVIALSEDELSLLANCEFQHERHERVRDLFLFQAGVGCRFSELEVLRPEWEHKGILKFLNRKGARIASTKLVGDALRVWRKHQGALPVISEQKYNEYIKEAAEIAGINEPVTFMVNRAGENVMETKPLHALITTHTARRTFATIYIDRGGKIDKLRLLLNHKNITTTQNYIRRRRKDLHDDMGIME